MKKKMQDKLKCMNKIEKMMQKGVQEVSRGCRNKKVKLGLKQQLRRGLSLIGYGFRPVLFHEFCSPPSTFCSHPAAMPKLPLRMLSHVA
jgi:hypothetical protein